MLSDNDSNIMAFPWDLEPQPPALNNGRRGATFSRAYTAIASLSAPLLAGGALGAAGGAAGGGVGASSAMACVFWASVHAQKGLWALLRVSRRRPPRRWGPVSPRREGRVASRLETGAALLACARIRNTAGGSVR